MVAAEKQSGQILSKEEIAAEDKFMEGIPRFNIAAFFMPFIWGPANGFWVCILYYPVLLFADNALYAAYTEQSVLSIVVAAVILISLIAFTAVFAILSQPYAAHRVIDRGMSKEKYLKRQGVWAVVSLIVFIAMIALATYYNLMIRPTIGL